MFQILWEVGTQLIFLDLHNLYFFLILLGSCHSNYALNSSRSLRKSFTVKKCDNWRRGGQGVQLIRQSLIVLAENIWFFSPLFWQWLHNAESELQKAAKRVSVRSWNCTILKTDQKTSEGNSSWIRWVGLVHHGQVGCRHRILHPQGLMKEFGDFLWSSRNDWKHAMKPWVFPTSK